MATNVLSARQISAIYRSLAEVFSEDLCGQLTVDFNKFKIEAARVIKNMNLVEMKHSSQPEKHKGWKLQNLSPRKRALSMKGYLLIFKFREYLLNEKINYRYYYEDSEGQSKVTTFTEENIAHYVKFYQSGIAINPSAAKYATAAEDYNAYVNYYFNLYTNPDVNNYMRKVTSYGRVVRSGIMAQYGHMNGGLRTKEGRYQAFNKGHIYEALDTSLSKVISDDEPSISDQMIESYVFGRYLALDNIRASQGGDNPITNTSIKSGGADLYDFYTIKTQLELILQLLERNTLSLEEMQTIIEKQFLHQSKFASGAEFKATANAALNKLLADLSIKN